MKDLKLAVHRAEDVLVEGKKLATRLGIPLMSAVHTIQTQQMQIQKERPETEDVAEEKTAPQFKYGDVLRRVRGPCAGTECMVLSFDRLRGQYRVQSATNPSLQEINQAFAETDWELKTEEEPELLFNIDDEIWPKRRTSNRKFVVVQYAPGRDAYELAERLPGGVSYKWVIRHIVESGWESVPEYASWGPGTRLSLKPQNELDAFVIRRKRGDLLTIVRLGFDDTIETKLDHLLAYEFAEYKD